MATKSTNPMDMTHAFGDLTKMLEQFKVPGVDTKEIVDARRKDIDALVQANQAIFDGMQALANKQGELLKAAMADIQSAVKGASGGVGGPGHMLDGLTKGRADAVLAASIFHYGEYSIGEVKKYLDEHGVCVRL